VTITIAPIPRRVARDLDLLADQTVEVVEVLPRGPAANAGIQAGDWIVAAGDRIVSGADDLHRVLSSLKAEQEVELQIVRDGRLQKVAVTPKWSG